MLRRGFENSRRAGNMKRQGGFTLVEMMVAMIISLIVSGAMVAVMANTLGTGTRTIAMTHLTQEIRAAMQIMSRDLRRANYISPAQARSCYQNANCLNDLGFADEIGVIEVGDDSDGDGFGECMSFYLDRDNDGLMEESERGGYRLAVAGGIGRIEMLMGSTGTAANNCPTGTWVAITDPDSIDVNSFVVDDTDTYTQTLTGGANQTTQKIRMVIDAELINTGNVGYTISRVIGDEIRIRNDFVTP